ncbi:MAG TPA: nodulation protein NfeD [Anaerolineales bacterium]|nr:nodulation protein NfeD [Anaerolineales bacterium]
MKPFDVMLRVRICTFLFIWVFVPVLVESRSGRVQAATGAVFVVELRGVINPPVANYLKRALRDAEEQRASLVVIQMDTPGGLDHSMREIIQDILSSPVPVAVYVSPSGARAASAGLFILLSSDVAAMAPGTNTGAAHPVGLGGEADDVSIAKAVNDAAATIRSLATEQGRNAEWAEQAVRESVSVTEREALELDVIDVVALDLDDLLQKIDGRRVQTTTGEIALRIVDASRLDVPMNFAERFLHVISDPNIAFILLSVGSIGLIAELYNPGTLFPGITGAIALILAFFALGNLPTNWAGVALITLALILFIAELYTEGLGPLGFGALVAFLLGGLILFQPFRPGSPALPDVRVDPWVVGGATVSMGAFMLIVMAQVVRSHKAPLRTGPEQLIGRMARVYQDLTPRGRVWFEGQTWFAEVRSGQSVTAGQTVRVVDLNGLTLIVEPAEEEETKNRKDVSS